MDVVIRSNNNPVNDMAAQMRGHLDKVIKTKSSQSLFG